MNVKACIGGPEDSMVVPNATPLIMLDAVVCALRLRQLITLTKSRATSCSVADALARSWLR